MKKQQPLQLIQTFFAKEINLKVKLVEFTHNDFSCGIFSTNKEVKCLTFAYNLSLEPI